MLATRHNPAGGEFRLMNRPEVPPFGCAQGRHCVRDEGV